MAKSKLAEARESADPIDVEVGLRVRMRRKELKVSQTALANHLALSFQQIQKYELGVNRISASMLVRIAEKLNCSVAYLVGEGDKAALRGAQGAVLDRLSVTGAVELLDAYAAVDPRWRKMLLEIARTMSRESRAAKKMTRSLRH